MSTSQTLWEESNDLAAQCLNHPFITSLADGSLPLEKFKNYIAQDAFFLNAFFKAYALAASKTGNSVFVSLQRGVMDEIELHKSYSKRLDINLALVKPYEATLAYVHFLLATAHESTADEIIAAMTPCMRLYWHIGSTLAKQEHADTYKEWIDTYSSEEFKELVDQLESLLDEYDTTQALRNAYSYAMICELNFFEAAYEK